MKHTSRARHVAFVLAALFVLPLIGPVPSPAGAAELISTPNDPAAWKLETQGGGSATLRQEQDALRIDIDRAGTMDWHVQIYQKGKSIPSNSTCILKFTAKASPARTIKFNSQVDVSPWRMVLSQLPTAELTPQWQSYTVELPFAEVNSDQVRAPMFLMGDRAGTVWLKDVSLTSPGSAGAGAGGMASPTAPSSTTMPPSNAPASLSAPTGNLLANPMDSANWRFESRDAARARFGMEQGMLRIDVDSPGTEANQVQLYQVPQSLVAGRTYYLTINVRSTAPRKLAFTVQQDPGAEMLLPATELNIGPEWKQYKLRFPLKRFAPGQTRLPVLQMGNAAGTVYIRTISLVEASDVAAPASAP